MSPLHAAFKLKLRNEILPDASTTDPKAFEEKITLTRDIAEVLRKNIVQARRVENSSPEDKEKWRTSPRVITSYVAADSCVCRTSHNEAYRTR